MVKWVFCHNATIKKINICRPTSIELFHSVPATFLNTYIHYLICSSPRLSEVGTVYRWENWGPERLCNLHKVSQPKRDRFEVWTWAIEIRRRSGAGRQSARPREACFITLGTGFLSPICWGCRSVCSVPSMAEQVSGLAPCPRTWEMSHMATSCFCLF